MLGMLELVGKLLAGLGIQEHVAFEPLTENVIMIGQRLRLIKTASAELEQPKANYQARRPDADQLRIVGRNRGATSASPSS